MLSFFRGLFRKAPKQPNIGRLNEMIEWRDSVLPYRIVIETLSYCNGVCSFCPANKIVDTRGKNAMSDEVFDKIVSDLAEWKYNGVISLHGNSEPLLNPNIVSSVKKLRDALPDAVISIWTNGTKLDWTRHSELFAVGLTHMHINNYSPKESWHRSVTRFREEFEKSEYAARDDIFVEFFMRKVDEVLLNKGGIAPNKIAGDSFETIQGSCGTPMAEMQINYKGDLFSCCFDDYYSTILGNVIERPLHQIWNSEAYRKYRREVVNGNRKNYPACANCDTPHNLPSKIVVKEAGQMKIFVGKGVFTKPSVAKEYEKGSFQLF